MSADPVTRVLDALTENGCEPRRVGNGWEFRSPLREDRNPGGSLRRGSDGRALLFDFGDGGPDVHRRIAESIGLRESDLFPRSTRTPSRKRPSAPKPSPEPTYETLDDVLAELQRRHDKPSAT